MTIPSFMSHITYLPAEVQPDDLAVPARFQFVLTNKDWHLLNRLAAENGGAIAMFHDALDIATSDEQGREMDMPEISEVTTPEEFHALIQEWPHFCCTIPVNEFIKSDLRPADFNEYLGETQLIPIVYDMVHFIHPTADQP